MMMRWIRWLASPAPVFWLLPPLMLVVTVGTVAQKYIGLYRAEQLFFSSWVFWLGGVLPLPGGLLLITLFGVALAAKFIFKSQWTWRRAGINLAHFGVLVLLLGGAWAMASGEDGFISIPEGQSLSQLRDYHRRDLMLIKDGQIVSAINAAELHPGLVLKDASFPFTLEVLETCRNCAITQRAEAAEDMRSMARGMQITSTTLAKEDEANTGGLTFRISGLGGEHDGRYILFEDGPLTDLGSYQLAYGKQLRVLPFSVTLRDFVKTTYPGTDKAKDYYSDVIITDGAISWPARIAMNAPLRTRGYTLYQSSFSRTQDGREVSTLAISRNRAQVLPYLGTGIMAAGLLLHLLTRRREGV